MANLTPEPSAELRRLGRAGPNAGEMDLLRAATMPAEAANAAWRRWVDTHTIDEAHPRSADLLPAVSANLPAEVLGDEAPRLRGLRRRVWADNQFVLGGLVDAATLLQGAGIEPVVAKGAALATTVYTEPGTRAMSDADLVVGTELFETARQSMLDAGWRQIDLVEGPFFHAIGMVDERRRNVDLHKWVVFPRFSPTPELAWLDRAVPHEVQGHPVRRLTSPDELVLAVVHGLLTNSPSATRWPIDVVQLARTAAVEDAFWSDVLAAAIEIEAGPVVADAVAMCRVELDADIPMDAIEALRAAPLDRGLAQHWALCRRGISLEWRVRRYRRLERSAGRKPSVVGYVAPRLRAIRTRSLTTVISGRVRRGRHIVEVRIRD